MNRRAFTLIELIIVILIIAIIAAIAIPNLIAEREKNQQRRQNVSTPITMPVTPTPGTAPSPERPSGYEVHTVNAPRTNSSLEATQIHETLVSWLREHPSHEIISIIRANDGSLVIVTKNR
jgi:prepilin-type N-terminal cleavage/methylation domain-containing protein